MKKPVNSLNYLYNKAQSEKDVNLIHIYKIVNAHFKYEKIKQLTRFCEISDKIAIHALRMTEHQRKKHRHKHINLNGQTFYLFDRLSAWAVGVIPEKDVYIYDSN